MFGAYDMAGNVREWCWNETPKGKLVTGGAWNDATYLFGSWSQASPFDRSAKNGFRCAFYLDFDKIAKPIFQPAKLTEVKDWRKEKLVSDSVFQVYKEQFTYDKTDLNARVEWRNDTSKDWIQERITFNAAYDKDRMIAYLFIPKNTSPPYQTVIYFPGSGSVYTRSSKDLDKYGEFESISFIVKNGRAVLYPVYKGTFERGDEAIIPIHCGANSHQYTEYLTKIVKDFRRCIDYLETRQDIDSKRLAYLGFSWGGLLGSIIPCVEERLKASILALGGMWCLGRPETQEINYVTRVKIPTLMLNGRFDMILVYETDVKPMFDLLGTPKEHKALKIYDTDHSLPGKELIKETLNWLDKYLGPVK
jgi:dienelactone hydrolase